MISAPRLTVVLVARDAAPGVASTIRSILDQRDVSFELVVLDDGSRDGTAEVVGAIVDPRLHLIRLPAPQGNPHCWNRALRESRSPYVTIVGENDRVLGSALAELVGALDRNPAAGLAHGHWFGVDDTGRITLEAFRAHRRWLGPWLAPDIDYRRALVAYGIRVQAMPTYRRDLVVALGGFEESRGDGADYALALRLLDRAEILAVPKFLCCRPHSAPERPGPSWWGRIAIGRSLIKGGSARFLASEPYRLRRIAIAGLRERLRPRRLQDLAERAYWRIRRGLRSVSPRRLIRDRLGSGRAYQRLADRMSWWPPGRPRRRPQGTAPARIAYALWRYPLLSETFIRREIHALRGAGVVVDVIADEPGEATAENHPAAPTGEALYLYPADPARTRKAVRTFRASHPLRLLNLFLYTVFHRYAREKSLGRDMGVLHQAVYLADVLRERGATHVHSPWADQHAFLVLLASRLLGIPYSVQARAHEIHRTTANYALGDKLRHAKFVVTNSAFNAAHLEPLMGSGAGSRLHTIYNGIDLAQFRPSPPRAGDPGPLRLLAVGRLVEQKGFDDLLRACALLRDRGLDFRCDIIGGPREPEDTNSYVLLGKLHRRLNLGAQVRFLGELPFSRILDAYRTADLFVLPCVVAADGGSDVTPNALIEAMAMGLPVVSTPIAAIPEIVEAGISGLLVPPHDPAALADALMTLLTDAALRARLGVAARQRVEERFDIEKNIRRYVALFTPPASA